MIVYIEIFALIAMIVMHAINAMYAVYIIIAMDATETNIIILAMMHAYNDVWSKVEFVGSLKFACYEQHMLTRCFSNSWW